jgi:hypothetical protein
MNNNFVVSKQVCSGWKPSCQCMSLKRWAPSPLKVSASLVGFDRAVWGRPAEMAPITTMQYITILRPSPTAN